jgi:hypothetical protein
MQVNTLRARSCDRPQFDTYAECLANAPTTRETWKVPGTCARRAPKLDAFCRRVSSVAGGSLDQVLGDHEPRTFPEAAELAGRCTAEAQCPSDYARLAPYLGAFCAGALGEASLATLQEDVAQGRISKMSLSLLFNAHGALYGFQFKRERWLNAFFYGAGEWLPPACRAAFRTLRTAREVPLPITKLRDRVKKMWAKAR